MLPPRRRPDWFPDWEGQTITIVGSGPSAVDEPLDAGIGHSRFIAINRSWRLCPWADCLMAVDYQWWDATQGSMEFEGPLKVSVDGKVKHYKQWNVKYLNCLKPHDTLFLDRDWSVGWGGNGGFCALNFAALLKPKKILLVGYDMTKAYGEHWHEPHGRGLSNPTVVNIQRWRKAVDNAAPVLEGVGITVINCSPCSALKAYRKAPYEEALFGVDRFSYGTMAAAAR